MAGSFEVVAWPENSRTPYEIRFRQIRDVVVDPEDIQFCRNVARHLQSFKRLMNFDSSKANDPDVRSKYTDLLGTAKAAVQYPHGSVEIRQHGLEDFENSALVDLGRISLSR